MRDSAVREKDAKARKDQVARLKENMEMIKHKIVVISGKGEGKTTVSVKLPAGRR